jgi:hypothetical protein
MLADLVLVMHAAFVLFVVGGLPAIWIGFASGRRWCTNPWFRGLHLAAIGFVVVASLLGYACPLTVWEDALRGASPATGFIQRWVSAILYWNAPTWVFTALYVAFGALVVWTWIRVPPRWGRRSSGVPRPR